MKKPISDSYDEIVLRRQGGPSPGRGARRPAGAGPSEDGSTPEVVTEVRPQDITQKAVGLSRMAARLGVPAAGAEELRQLAADTDEQVGFWAPVLSDLAEEVPAAAAAAGTSRKELDERLAQRTELSLLRGTATQVRSDSKDSRRQTGAEVRQGMRALAEKIRADLQPGAKDRKQQDRLRSSTQEFLRLWDRVEAGPQEQRDRTRSEGAAHAQALAVEEERAAGLRALVALRGGGPLGQDEWDRAAAAYDTLNEDGGAEPNRRGQLR